MLEKHLTPFLPNVKRRRLFHHEHPQMVSSLIEFLLLKVPLLSYCARDCITVSSKIQRQKVRERNEAGVLV